MANIKDVARAVGLSITTVSRALNGYSDVNKDTRERIIKAAKDMNYTPSRTAQRLVKKTSNTLAIIVSDISPDGSYIVHNILTGFYNYAESINYEVVLFTTNTSRQKKKSYYQFCREHGIEGAVVCGISTDDQYFAELMNSDIPCVLIDIPAKGEKTGSVSIDNESASQEAVEFLIKNNHRNIAIMNGSMDALVSHERLNGYLNALEKHGIKKKDDYILYGDFIEDKAYQAAKSALKHNAEITAVFCSSDLMAIGVIKAARELGRKLPEDLSIVGFDDISLARYVTPALTTIRQDMVAFGEESGRLLQALIKGEKCERKKLLPYELIIRESVAKALC
ncbi:MAG: LacI family DNA-binding transcriptional regulator [Bacillota bacterium]